MPPPKLIVSLHLTWMGPNLSIRFGPGKGAKMWWKFTVTIHHQEITISLCSFSSFHNVNHHKICQIWEYWAGEYTLKLTWSLFRICKYFIIQRVNVLHQSFTILSWIFEVRFRIFLLNNNWHAMTICYYKCACILLNSMYFEFIYDYLHCTTFQTYRK